MFLDMIMNFDNNILLIQECIIIYHSHLIIILWTDMEPNFSLLVQLKMLMLIVIHCFLQQNYGHLIIVFRLQSKPPVCPWNVWTQTTWICTYCIGQHQVSYIKKRPWKKPGELWNCCWIMINADQLVFQTLIRKNLKSW